MKKPKDIVLPSQITARDLRPFAKLALDQGWSIRLRHAGHLAWKSPSGYTIFSSSSPSDWRAVKKLRKQLIDAGLEVPEGMRK